MARGITNPFFDPPPQVDPKSTPIHHEGATKREAPLPRSEGHTYVDLDGDSYLVRFHRVSDIPTIVRKLLDLVYALKPEYEEELKSYGIYYEERPQTWSLKDNGGRIFYISVPEGASEVDVYRRLGYALLRLRTKIEPMLKKLGITVMERG